MNLIESTMAFVVSAFAKGSKTARRLYRVSLWAVRDVFDTLKLKQFVRAEHAQVGGTNIVRLMIGVAVAVLVGVGVAVPIINDVIADGNLSGVEETIASFISTIIILVIFMAAASPIMGR